MSGGSRRPWLVRRWLVGDGGGGGDLRRVELAMIWEAVCEIWEGRSGRGNFGRNYRAYLGGKFQKLSWTWREWIVVFGTGSSITLIYLFILLR